MYSSAKMNPRLAWLLQEQPSFFVPVALWAHAPAVLAAPNTALLSLFVVHYYVRSFIYPILIAGGKPFPVSTMLSALFFCLLNGTLQGWTLSFGPQYPEAWLTDARFIIGACLWTIGFLMNQHSDHVLRNLRAPGDTGYKIPYGGAFRVLSAPNLIGEVIQWSGYALACWNLPAAAFAVFTAANLLPRALTHHQWYRAKFPTEYPPERRAWLPFVF